MKLSSKFIVHNTENESLLVPTGAAEFSGIVRGNSTLGFIYDCLNHETTREEIAAKMTEQYDAPMDVILRDIDKTLDSLRSIGALDE